MRKWSYFWMTIKAAFINLFVTDANKRYWIVEKENRWNDLLQMEKDYNALKAECEMWYTIATLYKNKIDVCSQYIERMGGVKNEK